MVKELQQRILSSLILISVVFYIVFIGDIYFNILIMVCFAISLYEWHRLSFQKKYYLFGIIYLIISFGTAYFLRLNNDFFIFLLVLLICIFTDIGGFIFGKLFKGPKFTKISPKKTYTGLFGSFFMPIIFLLPLKYMESSFINQSSLYNNIVDTNLYFFIILLISTASQIGDILVSYFKRLANLKDTGNIIPGHGGLLDRIDGMLLAFPVALLIFKNL